MSLPVIVGVLPFTTLLVWWFQRRQSPGPLFYRQTRAGLQNREFEILKYRTMNTGHGAQARQATSGDPRIYPAAPLVPQVFHRRVAAVLERLQR